MKIKIKNPSWVYYSQIFKTTSIEFELTEMQFIGYDVIDLAQNEKMVEIEVYDKVFSNYVIDEFSGPNRSNLYRVHCIPYNK